MAHDEHKIPMNPNRIVSVNLRRARVLRGMTQDEAAEALAPYLGVRWRKQTVSMAEAAAETTSRAPRQFDAADIAAFAQAFRLPIGWFFMPPPFPRTRAQFEAGEPHELPGAFNADEPAVEVGALVDSIIEPISDEKLYEVVNDGPTGYRGLREYLEARKAERDRIRALRDGPPAQIVFDDTTEEL